MDHYLKTSFVTLSSPKSPWKEKLLMLYQQSKSGLGDLLLFPKILGNTFRNPNFSLGTFRRTFQHAELGDCAIYAKDAGPYLVEVRLNMVFVL